MSLAARTSIGNERPLFTSQSLIYDIYRLMKQWAQLSNGRNVENTMMLRENIRLSIRLLHGGCFPHIETSKRILNIIDKCPTTFESLFAVADRADEDCEPSTLAVESDHWHYHTLTAKRLAKTYVMNELHLPSKCSEVSRTHAFNTELRKAYNIDYKMGIIYDLE